jgi:hypothetical protein
MQAPCQSPMSTVSNPTHPYPCKVYATCTYRAKHRYCRGCKMRASPVSVVTGHGRCRVQALCQRRVKRRSRGGGGGWLSRSSVAKAWLTRNFLEFTAIETLYSKASYSDLIQSYRNLINWDKLPQITPFSVSDECGLIQYKVK